MIKYRYPEISVDLYSQACNSITDFNQYRLFWITVNAKFSQGKNLFLNAVKYTRVWYYITIITAY